MSVEFRIPIALQRYSDERGELHLEAARVGAALEALFALYPALRERVLDESGTLHPYLLLFKNQEQLERDQLAAVEVSSGDVLDLIAAVEGGSGATPQDARDVRMRGFRERKRVEAALAAALDGLTPLEAEELPVTAAAGRVLASAVESKVDVPAFDRSAMDGYAVRAADTFGASAYEPLQLALSGESMPGFESEAELGPGQACRIMTGAPIPAGADAVLMAEDAEEDAGVVLVRAAVSPHKNIGRRGEDVRAGARVLERGRRLRPQDVGLLASIGCASLSVVRRPRVRLLVSGNELLPPGAMPSPGRVVDSNTPMLAALVERDGGELVEALRVQDERAALEEALLAPGADLVLAAGGSSVGREDWLPVLVRELGELPVHGVAMRPSAPTGIGTIAGVRVLLLPGNPVSCLCAYDFFAGPVLRRLGGRDERWPYPALELPLARRVSSIVGRLDYVRVALEGQADERHALPLAVGGAGVLSSTTRAHGFAVIPEDSEGVGEGERLRVWLYDALDAETRA